MNDSDRDLINHVLEGLRGLGESNADVHAGIARLDEKLSALTRRYDEDAARRTEWQSSHQAADNAMAAKVDEMEKKQARWGGVIAAVVVVFQVIAWVVNAIPEKLFSGR